MENNNKQNRYDRFIHNINDSILPREKISMPLDVLKKLYQEHYEFLGNDFEECAKNNGNWIETLAHKLDESICKK